MKYFGFPFINWILFGRSFKKSLETTLKINRRKAILISNKAKQTYKQIIKNLPEFEKGDKFSIHIVGCALFSAFYLNIDERPSLEQISDYYNSAMITKTTKRIFSLLGKKMFTPMGRQRIKQMASFRAADRNPYSWNAQFIEYEDGSGYEERISACGICTLMKELGIFDIVPAMCQFDYAMSEASGNYVFVRKYTLATGGPYCDCGYKKCPAKGYYPESSDFHENSFLSFRE